MSEYYYQVTARIKRKVGIRYTCGKCGREVNGELLKHQEYEAAAGGISEESRQKARTAATQKALENMDKDWKEEIEKMRKEQVRHVCPYCGITNMADAGCKRKQMHEKATNKKALTLILTPLIGGLIVFIIYCIIFIKDWGAPANFPPETYLPAIVFFIASIVIPIVYYRKKSDKAYADPALMEKAYNTVLNKGMYADLSEYGEGEILLGEKQ